MQFPSDTAFWIGAWPVRWYGISYGVGIILAWLYARLCVQKFSGITKKNLDDFINWGVLGIVIGGRLGHVLLYNPVSYWHNPIEIFKIWHGGMSFHGGILGVVAAFFLYSHFQKISFWSFADCWACATPIGLFFGRIANFVNQELYGKVSKGWGIVFPAVDDKIRHPSQLYEAALEGIGLFVWLAYLLWWKKISRKPGCLSGNFLLGYGLARWFSEYFREPLEMSGFWHISLGQLYSLPMIIMGIGLCLYAQHKISFKTN